jgi:hypothetical protein
MILVAADPYLMDEKDVFGSPDWRPLSSLGSDGLLQSRRGSIDLSGSLTHDVNFLETSTCDLLIESLETESPLQAALQKTKDTFQRHAKWFTQAGLAKLLRIALFRTANSRATVDLYAALEFIDSIGTFAVLPPESILPAMRFIAYAYYQGTRMNKHKSLADKAWGVFQHTLQSHMGQQAIGALLEILSFAQEYQSKAEFAAASGALKLIEEKLPLGDRTEPRPPFVPVFQILPCLRSVAQGSDEILREQVFNILSRIFNEEHAISELRNTASWDVCIDVLEICYNSAQDGDASSILEHMAKYSSSLERKSLERLALIFVKASQPLTQPMLEAMLSAPFAASPLEAPPLVQHQDLFYLLCRSQEPEHHTALDRLISLHLESIVYSEGDLTWESLVDMCADQAARDDCTTQAAIACTGAVGTIFHRAFAYPQSSDRLTRTINKLVDVMTKLAISAFTAEARMLSLRVLSRLRAAVDGAVYLAGDDGLDNVPSGPTVPNYHKAAELPLDKWMDHLVALIDGHATSQDQHCLNFVLATLPEQLSNLSLFYKRPQYPKELFQIACTRLNAGGGPHAASFVHLLTTLISYRGLLSSQEERQLVAVFTKTAGSSEVVSKACIHALTICCYEISEAAMRHLEDIVQKMHRMVTQRHLAIHVLEFLTGLSRLPYLYNNFRFDDFKRIFGVCFSYLDYLRSSESDPVPQKSDQGSSSDHNLQHTPQYVHALAHHVIVFWYFAVRESDRQPIKEYVTSRLKHTTKDGQESYSDQALVTIDLMDSVDAEATHGEYAVDKTQAEPFDEKLDGRLTVRHRLFGLLLISTTTALRNGRTLVTVRRPSGTFKSQIRGGASALAKTPTKAQPTLHIEREWGDAADALKRGGDEVPVFFDDPQGRLYGSIMVPSTKSPLGAAGLIELPDADAVQSAIRMFDRTPGLDSHKAGVIYVGEGQVTETAAFANSSGAPDYREFVEHLGQLRRLKGAAFNTQGLDTRDNMDGEFAIVWNNEVTELVYHVTTMMPASVHDDEMAVTAKKKRHTGNDYVNIVFNNSGEPFRFDMFPSAFNYVYIIITPSVRTTFLQTRTHTMQTPVADRFYRVEVMTRDDFPGISSASEPKMISGASLPRYVRNLALNACIFAEVWVNKDVQDYRSSWRERLSQIRRLRDRFGPKEVKPLEDGGKGKEKENHRGSGKSVLASWIGGGK